MDIVYTAQVNLNVRTRPDKAAKLLGMINAGSPVTTQIATVETAVGESISFPSPTYPFEGYSWVHVTSPKVGWAVLNFQGKPYLTSDPVTAASQEANAKNPPPAVVGNPASKVVVPGGNNKPKDTTVVTAGGAGGAGLLIAAIIGGAYFLTRKK
jgi:hypothetical protein